MWVPGAQPLEACPERSWLKAEPEWPAGSAGLGAVCVTGSGGHVTRGGLASAFSLVLGELRIWLSLTLLKQMVFNMEVLLLSVWMNWIRVHGMPEEAVHGILGIWARALESSPQGLCPPHSWSLTSK